MTKLILQGLNLDKWLRANSTRLKPPVNNAILWPDDDLMVQMLSGPNKRSDYHDDPYSELFIQLKGDISLDIIEQGQRREVNIREGEIFVCPAHLRHCPRRGEGTFGLVVEVQRTGDEIDAFEWYCPSCVTMLHRVELKLRDPEADGRRAAGIFNEFYADSQLRTCTHCGTVHPRP